MFRRGNEKFWLKEEKKYDKWTTNDILSWYEILDK